MRALPCYTALHWSEARFVCSTTNEPRNYRDRKGASSQFAITVSNPTA
jgi:hypothetical protein